VTIDRHTDERIDESFRHSDFFNNGYSLTKYKGEKIAFEYGVRGVDISTVHPTLVYGPRETNNLLGLVRSYVEPPVRFKRFVNTVFNFVYVDDVVEGHIHAMERGRAGERYLLGGEERTIEDFLALVDELTGTEKPSITVPKPLVRLGASRVDPLLERVGLSLPVSEAQVHAMEYDSKVDDSKLRSELGVEPTPLRAGLEETIRWYCQEGYLSLLGSADGLRAVAPAD
jgi:nucleoside-diphosphate-sugar epimerase